MIRINSKKRDIEDSIWNVFTSFGFCEVEKNEDIDEKGKFLWFSEGKAEFFNTDKTEIAKAELVAMVAEVCFANGVEDFEILVSCDKVIELLTLFGFEKIVRKTEKEGFFIHADGVVFAKGNFESVSAEFNLNEFIKVLENEGVQIGAGEVSKSLIFAEEDAQGLSYDVAYNLRVNGCIVEYFTGEGDIYKAEEYAKNNGFECILRAFKDGKLQMKDIIKDEITETTVGDFLGYYEDEEECDCGDHHDHHCDCGHDHDHECSCGHHHDHEHDCDCGHHHGH